MIQLLQPISLKSMWSERRVHRWVRLCSYTLSIDCTILSKYNCVISTPRSRLIYIHELIRLSTRWCLEYLIWMKGDIEICPCIIQLVPCRLQSFRDRCRLLGRRRDSRSFLHRLDFFFRDDLLDLWLLSVLIFLDKKNYYWVRLLFSQISKTNTYSMGCWLRLRLTRSSSGFFSDSFCSTSSEYSTSNGRKLSLESWYLLLNLKIDGIQYLSFIPDTVIVRIYPGVRASFISRLISLEVHIDDRGCTICVCSVRYFT